MQGQIVAEVDGACRRRPGKRDRLDGDPKSPDLLPIEVVQTPGQVSF